jgi:hypothetical protein
MAARQGMGWLGATLFCVYACAKATDSDLGGGAYDPNAAGKSGSGAKSGTGGFGGTGGSSAAGTAGRGGSTSGRAGTGPAGGSGGTSPGGTGNTAAKGGAGGSTGGSIDQGGQAGDDGVPPDVLANADVVLYYVNQQTATVTHQPQMRLFLINQADTALNLAHVVVRYWMTAEANDFKLESFYAAPMVSQFTLSYVSAGAKSCIEATFASGSIPSNNTDKNAAEFQVALLANMNATVDQSDDWSFDPNLTGEPQPNGKITVYLADKLVWGCEPSGKCAGEDGAGGAGGQGGESGAGGSGATGGASGTSGTGQGGQTGAGQGGEPSAGQGGA